MTFAQMDIYGDHVMAIDSEGQLWAWGSNSYKKCGNSEDTVDMFHPQLVKKFNETYVAKSVKCGSDHTLVMAVQKDDPTQKERLLSIGYDESFLFHLGISSEDVVEGQFIYEIPAFKTRNVLFYTAGAKVSYVIIKGEEKISSGVQEHTLPDTR